jgi:predicted transcriptional regulator
MEHLWTEQADHPAGLSVREVHDAIGVERGLAYTTLMTVLDRLAKKELVERERDGRAWRYTAAATRHELTSETLHHTLGDLAGTERKSALLHFLDESTPQEIDELKAALEELEARQASEPPSTKRGVAGRLRRRKGA